MARSSSSEKGKTPALHAAPRPPRARLMETAKFSACTGMRSAASASTYPRGGVSCAPTPTAASPRTRSTRDTGCTVRERNSSAKAGEASSTAAITRILLRRRLPGRTRPAAASRKGMLHGCRRANAITAASDPGAVPPRRIRFASRYRSTSSGGGIRPTRYRPKSRPSSSSSRSSGSGTPRPSASGAPPRHLGEPVPGVLAPRRVREARLRLLPGGARTVEVVQVQVADADVVERFGHVRRLGEGRHEALEGLLRLSPLLLP